MKQFDQRIKELAKTDGPVLSQEAAKELERVMAALPEQKNKTGSVRRRFWRRGMLLGAAAVLLLFLLLPNLSADIAYAMEQIPVIGELVKVITVREYQFENEHYEFDVKVPEIVDESGYGEGINSSVKELTDQVLEQFYEDTDEMRGAGHRSLQVGYKVLTNNERWFTLKLTVTETAASSNVYDCFYHIDKQSGNIVEFADLFRPDSDYDEAVGEEIRRQMREQMETSAQIVYWLEGSLPEAEFTSLADNQGFYWDEQGQLVIVFAEGEVGPSSMGCPEFVIPREVYEKYLKADFADLTGR